MTIKRLFQAALLLAFLLLGMGSGRVWADAEPTAVTTPDAIGWVGNMWPRGGSSSQREVGDASGLTVYVQVYKGGVTEAAGQGAGIQCYLHWGSYGSGWSDIAMTYNVDIGSNDEYMATIPTGALGVDTYGFTAYCTDDGGATKFWKQDNSSVGDYGDGVLSITPASDPTPAPSGGVFVHLFEWKWTDIEAECAYLASKGYDAIQVSPPQEHIQGTEWWTRYQPVSHLVANATSRSGTWAEFQSMVTACNTEGVDIYVDAIINHMSAGSGTGTAGTSYTKYSYPGDYSSSDFHNAASPCEISNYSIRSEVQNCELLGLADLDTSAAYVQGHIRAYLQALVDAGVKGVRIDAAKHIFTNDLEGILNGLTGSPYVFQEVIESGTEPFNGFEYFYNGDVTEFNYERGLAPIFKTGNIADLETFASGADFMPSEYAVVFTNNHDDQRQNQSLAIWYGDSEHDLANIFMLGWPYGYPKVMSSYYFSNHDEGPPSTDVYSGGSPTGCDDTNWVCEHRRTAIANMVLFRSVTDGEAVTNWWDNDFQAIAYGRGDKGYVAINHEDFTITRTWQTDMAAGVYCDITHYDIIGTYCVDPSTGDPADVADMIVVDSSGQIVNRALTGQNAFAIHTSSRVETDYGDLPVTPQGEAIHILTGGVQLGATIDGEAATGGSVTADTSDDGFVSLPDSDWSDGSGSVEVNVQNLPDSTQACINIWVDWDNDGFTADDGNATNGGNTIGSLSVSANGNHTVVLSGGMPASGSFPSAAPVRIRIAPGACAFMGLLEVNAISSDPTGMVMGGEVEDYQLSPNPTSVGLQGLALEPGVGLGTTAVILLLIVGLALLLGTVLLLRRRRTL